MKNKKKLAAKIMKTSHTKVRIAPGALEDVQKAITRSDIRGLVAIGKIFETEHSERSHAGARKRGLQRRKGRRKGKGSKKGSKYSIISRKRQWISRIRVQREFIKQLRDTGLLSIQNYHNLYAKSKGGYFRNKRHIKLYLTEHGLVEKKK